MLVTDNGRHFTEAALQAWLKSIGCYPLFTAPRHPCSNGQAENFIRTLKTAVRTCAPTTLKELNRTIDNFLLQYRNANHATTGKTPAMLFKGRNLRTSNLDTTEVLFYRGNNSRPCDGLVTGNKGNRMFDILDRADGSVHTRHRDQVHISAPSSLPQLLRLPTTSDEQNVQPLHETSNPIQTPTPSATPISTPPSPALTTTPSLPGTPAPASGNSSDNSASQTEGSNSPSVHVRRSQRIRRRPPRFDDFV